MSEIETKIAAVRAMLAQRQLDGLLLQRVSSFAWATGGVSSAINTASTNGEGALLITQAGRWVLCNNIEATRLQGETSLTEQGWEFHVSPWHAPSHALAELAAGLRLGADGPVAGLEDLSGPVGSLRAALLPEEQARFREGARRCAAAMNAAIRDVRPGWSEYRIGSRLAGATLELGVEPIVTLIAADERISAYRHPTCTDKRLERYAMLVLCGRYRGLVVSLTRLVYFGRLPEELRRKQEACARVDAALITATRPGATLGQVFAAGQAAYAAQGYDGEWELHHQGGPAGYEPREMLGLPGSTVPVLPGQAFAWNPSITGVKSEDSILVQPGGCEVATEIPGWPALEIELNGQVISRPLILEIE